MISANRAAARPVYPRNAHHILASPTNVHIGTKTPSDAPYKTERNESSKKTATHPVRPQTVNRTSGVPRKQIVIISVPGRLPTPLTRPMISCRYERALTPSVTIHTQRANHQPHSPRATKTGRDHHTTRKPDRPYLAIDTRSNKEHESGMSSKSTVGGTGRAACCIDKRTKRGPTSVLAARLTARRAAARIMLLRSNRGKTESKTIETRTSSGMNWAAAKFMSCLWRKLCKK